MNLLIYTDIVRASFVGAAFANFAGDAFANFADAFANFAGDALANFADPFANLAGDAFASFAGETFPMRMAVTIFVDGVTELLAGLADVEMLAVGLVMDFFDIAMMIASLSYELRG